jgi:predicted transcriptional regulator
MKITSVALPFGLTAKIDRVARDADRSRSWVIRNLLERSLNDSAARPRETSTSKESPNHSQHLHSR